MNQHNLPDTNSPWRDWRIRYYFKAKPKGVNPIHYLRGLHERRMERWLQRQEPELYDLIKSVTAASTSTGCGFSDYVALLAAIRHHRPGYILECGSGISSCVIAYACERLSYDGRTPVFISMEEDEFYHDQIERIFPDELRTFVDFRFSERQQDLYEGLAGCYYADLPDLPFDFVYIDGPTLSKDQGFKSFNADLINVLLRDEKKGEIFAMLDQRVETYFALKHLAPTAQINYHPIKRLTEITVFPGDLLPSLQQRRGVKC